MRKMRKSQNKTTRHMEIVFCERMDVWVRLDRVINVLWESFVVQECTELELDSHARAKARHSSSAEIISINVLLTWDVMQIRQCVAAKLFDGDVFLNDI